MSAQNPRHNESTRLPVQSRSTSSLRESLMKIARILPLAYGYMWTAALVNLSPPFYPALATARGLATWESGFVFSAMKIGMFMGSVSMNKMISCFSPTRTYLIGQCLTLLYCGLFGTLNWIPAKVFFWLSILAMLIGGFSMIIQNITMYAAATLLYSTKKGNFIAIMEAIFGVGLMVGPIVGGALIGLWAFPLPFFVVGILQILPFPFIARNGVTPKERLAVPPTAHDAQAPKQNLELRRLLLNPIFLANMVTLMLAWVIIGFNDPTLAPHTEQFNLNSMELGAVFMVPAISYAIGSLTAGLFCHLEMETFFAFCGQLMTVIAYLIIGPAPFFDTEPSLFSVCASIVLIGLGTAGQFICSFSNVLKYTMEQGYSDDVQTTGFVSSTVFGFLVIGGLISPPVGGYMVDTFGYRKGSMFMFALLLAWINDSSLLAQEVYPEDNAPRTVLKNDELHRTASAMSLDASGASSDGLL
ncbi:MFS-type transporter SLC18B1 isoform X3 [Ixodes scapularis]|uniref:MFS-type transporter SLC18B1 isoform X3 n=1 Tax=Ixodes scapularis TaxID=6945 RepID=UPI001C38594B|nr:MFS-type transporter SLC18B1 isoform X3 [Ixodes scapularis]